MMTAFIIVRLAEEDPNVLDEIVTFSARADKTSGSTSAVREGEKLSVGELLYGLMLPSGNDASVALAEHFGARFFAPNGSANEEKTDAYDHFIKRMNDVAAEIGMDSTQFDNPHGLGSDKHKTTARDLALLAHEAFKLPLFKRIVSTPQHGTTLDSVSGYRRNIVWRNTNQLLRTEGYDGIKTGTTGAAGNCLVSTAERDGRRLIVVVLGATSTDSRYTDTRNLFRWAWKDLVKIGDNHKSKSEQAGN
jgi:D-alanyl-D-alanine carboxypeptidase (penicillin-binding protein 5/6)